MSIRKKTFSTLLLGVFLCASVLPGEVDRVHPSMACHKIGHKLSSVSVDECLQLDLQASGTYTALGNPILYKEYPPLEEREPRARVLLLGGIHGDEYASFSVVFKWMHILDLHHSGLFHWRIAPALNLDGLLQSPATRVNHNRVDLNRNLPTDDWGNSLLHWKEETQSNPRRYPGPNMASEQETQWLIQEIEDFAPHVIISVHAPYGMVDYDGPEAVNPPQHIGHLKLGDLGHFPGSLGRYAEEGLDLPVLTIELASSRYMPDEEDIKQMWLDLVQWLIHGVGIAP